MKRIGILLICILMMTGALGTPAQGAAERMDAAFDTAYIPSNALEARNVPAAICMQVGDEEQWHTFYNPETAKMALELSEASYGIGEGYGYGWELTMKHYGYQQLQFTENNAKYAEKTFLHGYKIIENGQIPMMPRAVNAIIGIRPMEYNGKTRYAVAIAFRGTDVTDPEDWLADLKAISNDEGFHQGMAENADFFCDVIGESVEFTVGGKTYSLNRIIEEMQEPNSKFCIIVTGHSLGGGLANLLVGRNMYNAGVHPSNVAAYTFAAAATAPGSYKYPHDNIYNIINKDDLVPELTVAMHKQIGRNFTYQPDDAFRIEHYGEIAADYDGFDSGWWRTVGFALSGFKPHNLKAVYRPILEIVSADIAEGTADARSDYSCFSTAGYNNFGLGEAVIDPYTFGHFTDEVLSPGMRFEGGVLWMEDDLNLSGSLKMSDPDDYLLVEGDLTISEGSTNDENHLSDGTLELHGDFYTTTGDGYFYHATGNHRTVFNGSGVQTVATNGNDQKTWYANLHIHNPKVNFQSAVPNFPLGEDAELTDTNILTVGHEIDLNGYTLQQAGSLSARMMIMDGGTLEVGGHADVHTITMLDGMMTVGGDLEVQSYLPFADGQVIVGGDCRLERSLLMQAEEDYLQVDGDLFLWAMSDQGIPDDHLSAGTVELKGDLDIDGFGTCTANVYRESGTHKTILSGSEPQTIWFARAGGDNRFENLCIRNPQTRLYHLQDVGLGEDAVITLADGGNEERIFIEGLLDLKEHTMTIDTTAWTNITYAAVTVHSLQSSGEGVLEVMGDMTLSGGAVDGRLIVSDSFTSTETLTFDGAQIRVGGDCALKKSMIMQNESDYLRVDGNLTVSSKVKLPDDHLSAGTVELKGDLQTSNGSNYIVYLASGTHRTIFSGTGEQKVSMGGMTSDKILQACLRNPKVILEAVHTLRLMESGALAEPGRCHIYGTLDYNGYKLAALGTFGRCNSVAGGSNTVQLAIDRQSETVIVTRPTEIEPEETIRILFTGYDEENRMTICQVMEFRSESAMSEHMCLENWPECARIQVFLLEGDYAPFCAAMALDL